MESIPLAGDTDGTLQMEFPGMTTAVAEMVDRMEVCPSDDGQKDDGQKDEGQKDDVEARS